MTPKVFISYARERQIEVEGLRSWLQDAGFETWSDSTIGGGEPWWELILSKIRECDVVLTCLSEEYLASDACTRERRYALDCRRSIIPLTFGSIKPDAGPSELIGRQHLRWRTPIEVEDVASLVGALHRAVPSPLPEPLPPTPEPPGSAFGQSVGDVLAEIASESAATVPVWTTHSGAPTGGLAVLVGRYSGDLVDDTAALLSQELAAMVHGSAVSELLPGRAGSYRTMRVGLESCVIVGLGIRGALTSTELASTVRNGLVALCVELHERGVVRPIVSVPGVPGIDDHGMRGALYAVLEGAGSATDALAEPAGIRLGGIELQWTRGDDAALCLRELTALEQRGLLPRSIHARHRLAVGDGGATGSQSGMQRWHVERVAEDATDADATRELVWGYEPPRATVPVTPVAELVAELESQRAPVSSGEALMQLLVPVERRLRFLGSESLRLRLDRPACDLPWEASFFDSIGARGGTSPAAMLRNVVLEGSDQRSGRATSPTMLVIDLDHTGPDLHHMVRAFDDQAVMIDVIGSGGSGQLRATEALFAQSYRVLHLVGSPGLDDRGSFVALAGADGAEVRALEIRQMAALPALVVVAPPDGAPPRSGSTMAAAAWCTELIAADVTAVIAPGLPIPDGAAGPFLEALYVSLADGEAFGTAVEAAQQTGRAGAARSFQCYGQPDAHVF